MQMIQFMEIVLSWFIAFWKDSLTFLLSHIQVGDSEYESRGYVYISDHASSVCHTIYLNRERK